jgi:hypothetical protein
MRGRFFTGTAAVVGVLLILTGCGAVGRGGHKGNAGPAPKPLEVMDRMRTDVRAAVQAVMPQEKLREPTYDSQNCSYSKWSDTSGSSKIVTIEVIAVDGAVSESRSVAEMVGVMVSALQGRGWKIVNPDKYGASDPTKEMAKPGIAGSVRLAGGRTDVGKGESVPTVNGTMFSDCLPNPDAKSAKS